MLFFPEGGVVWNLPYSCMVNTFYVKGNTHSCLKNVSMSFCFFVFILLIVTGSLCIKIEYMLTRMPGIGYKSSLNIIE